MILAGVLLKLGGYGLIRVAGLLKRGVRLLGEIVVGVRLWGAVIVGVGCLRHSDIKMLVARSSVVHIAGCIGGLFILRE